MGLFDNNYHSKHAGIVLIDGTNFFYRSALVQFKDTKVDFNIRITNFIKMFNKAVKSKPQYCAIVFDSGKANFRHALYPQYKANRNKHEIDDCELLLKTIKQILKYSGFAVLNSGAYEADDIIGSLSKLASPQHPVSIHSEDKDFIQLINANVCLIKAGQVYNEQTVKSKYGISPLQFIEYLALIGDKIDNIPGIKLWGEKTSVQHLQKFGNIKTICKEATLRKSLSGITDSGTVNLYKKLVTIKTDIEVVESINKLKVGERDFAKIKELSRKFKINIGNVGV
jgi:DNA polymerase-1